MIIEVESNPNCETSLFLRFKEVGPAKPISHVKSYDRSSTGEWCAVVGWNEEEPHVCQAFAQLIEDSGSGFGYVIFGGNGGIRIKPETIQEDWTLATDKQWGEGYLTLADERDLRYVPQRKGRESNEG